MSDDSSSHESPWECHASGCDLGTDGVSGGGAPALLSCLETLGGAETNGTEGRGGETGCATEDNATALQLEGGRSPVEEAGHEEEGVEDEELGSTVEEGEEAALALDATLTESDLSWLPIKRASVDQSEVSHHVEVGGSNSDSPVRAEASVSEKRATEDSGAGEWDIHCGSAQTDACHTENPMNTTERLEERI